MFKVTESTFGDLHYSALIVCDNENGEPEVWRLSRFSSAHNRFVADQTWMLDVYEFTFESFGGETKTVIARNSWPVYVVESA
jgi:hypothetical protein